MEGAVVSARNSPKECQSGNWPLSLGTELTLNHDNILLRELEKAADSIAIYLATFLSLHAGLSHGRFK